MKYPATLGGLQSLLRFSFLLGTPLLVSSPRVGAADSVWFDDAIPAGAWTGADGGDAWNWVGSNPTPQSGTLAHRSNLAPGVHHHYFSSASATLAVGPGDTLFTWVRLDPANPPREIMLGWFDGASWAHLAYWGENLIPWGTDGTASQRPMGALPSPGVWTRLEIPASAVDLEGRTLAGMGFVLYDGTATWDLTGKSTAGGADPPPAAPGNLTASAITSSTINLAWSDNATDETGFTVERSPDSTTFTQIASLAANATSYSDAGLTAGTTYYYRVRAFNSTGNSAYSNTASATTLTGSSTVTADFAPWPTSGAAPLGVEFDDRSTGPVVARNWTFGDGGTATIQNPYHTYRTAGTFTATLTVRDSGGQTSSKSATITVTSSQPQPPSAPSGLLASATSPSAIALAWTDTASNESGFTVERSTDNATFAAIASLAANTTSYSDTGLAAGTTYYYRVRAFNSTGNSAYSNTANATTPPSGGGDPPPITGDEANLRRPRDGDHELRILTPTLLELVRVNTKSPDPAHVDSWDWVDASGNFAPPDLSSLHVTVNGQNAAVSGFGFRRRPLAAPLWTRTDLAIGNSLFVRLASAVAEGQSVAVTNDGSLWPTSMAFAATADPLRFSPAIHVNQEGYLPGLPKIAIVGYYLGNLGEMALPTTIFNVVNASTGATVFQGTLTVRRDTGWMYSPTPYQNVYEANFSAFTTPGEYRVLVPGLGESMRFHIDDGVAMAFARTYAVGLLEQRSGFDVTLPFTRFTHAADHTAAAGVPVNASAPWDFTWRTVAGYASEVTSDNPPQTAPRLTSPSAQLFPFANQGPVDVAGGHFEAANYSRVTWNSAQVVHILMFAVDALPGVGALDNLGLPESGDGISDVMQEAKWEADGLAKLQDSDGGFFYAVNPINREYEGDVLPENGDPQVVWPKNTAATAAAVAALAQCASSPRFRAAFPAAATDYLARAQRGWQFLTDALARYGKDGAYQKIQHFGDEFTDADDLAWAACELFLATGDPQIHTTLKNWFPDPTSHGTWHWGWQPMFVSYGDAARSYAFAARSGRLRNDQLDANYLGLCEQAVRDGGDAALLWSNQSAYGTSFPENTKHVRTAGWYYSSEQALDLVAAQQISPSSAYLDAILRNLNYEAGCNPVNVVYVTGLGWKRQREIVDQYSANDRRILPKIGVPVSNLQEGFTWTGTYGGELGALCFPTDGAQTAPYPFYDRWADAWNVTTEASTTNYTRCFVTAAWLAAQTSTAGQAWRSTGAGLTAPASATRGQVVTVSLQVADPNLAGAKIIWEAREQEPVFGGTSYTFTPENTGPYWVEAEVQWPDGRRAFATATVTVN